MEPTISIKNHNNHAAVRFNPDEDIDMGFVQQALFSLIIAAIQPLTEEQKEIVVCSVRENMLHIFNKPKEEVLDFFINQCKFTNI